LDVQVDAIQGEWGNVPFAYTLGMVGEGRFLEEYEDLFTEVQQKLSEPSNDDEGDNAPVGANDNDAQAEAKVRRKVRRILKQEIAKVTDEIMDEVSERLALQA